MAEREPAVARELEPAGPAREPGRPAGRRHGARVLAVISAGGVLGALARDGLTLALPTPAGGVPWATLLVNVSGCLLIGVLMVLVLDVWEAHPLVRPFLGVGVLGGYTTFSTAVVDVQRLIVAGRPAVALGYLAGTAAAALAAVQVGVVLTRAAALPRPAGYRRSREGGTR